MLPLEAKLHIEGLNEAIDTMVRRILDERLAEKRDWPYYTASETAELLQVSVKTLLDKRKGYLQQLEYSKQGKTFWFLKVSLLEFVERNAINKKFRGVGMKAPRRILNISRRST